jgi:hypothetical protein
LGASAGIPVAGQPSPLSLVRPENSARVRHAVRVGEQRAAREQLVDVASVRGVVDLRERAVLFDHDDDVRGARQLRRRSRRSDGRAREANENRSEQRDGSNQERDRRTHRGAFPRRAFRPRCYFSPAPIGGSVVSEILV